MRNPTNMTIAVLCVSAAILIGVLVGLKPASAVTSESRAGDYIMINCQQMGTWGIVYVIDKSAQRLNGYTLEKNRRRIDLVVSQSLDQLFPAAPVEQPQRGQRR